MNTKNNSSLLIGALLALLPGCSTVKSVLYYPVSLFAGDAEETVTAPPEEVNAKSSEGLLALLDTSPAYAEDSPSLAWDHWNAESITPRVGRFLLNYDSDRDGPSIWNKWGKDIEDTMETFNRMVFHKNSDNPFQN